MDDKDVDAEIYPLKNDEKVQENNKTAADIREGIKEQGWLSRCRTGAFFASLFLCLTVVFAFSFIIPCPVRPFSQKTWSTQFTKAMTYTFLAVEDVNQDKVKDVIFLFQAEDNSMLNVSCEDGGFQFPCTFITALSGTNGSALWTRPVAEHVQLVKCGINNLGGMQVFGCIIIGTPDSLLAINTETGDIVWQKSSQFPSNNIAGNPIITIQDGDGDGVQDLMFIFSVEDKLQAFIISGKNGDRIGQNKSIGISKKEGYYMHLTPSGSQYVLFYAGGSVEGYSVKDLCSRIKDHDGKPAQYKTDPDWEAHSNLSVGYIPILSIFSSGDVRFLMKVPGKYYDNILVVKSEVSELLDGQKLHSLWSVNTTNIISKPALGYFKKDVLSIMMELGIRNGRKKVVIVDSNSGTVQWEVEMNLGITNPSPATLNTGDHRSVFLFWGEHALDSNDTIETKEILYMFHPSYPTVLLQLNNHTENIVMFDAFLFEKSRHACYVLLTGPKTTENFGTVSVSKRKLKEDIANSKVIWLSEEEANSNKIRDHFFRMRYTSHSNA